MRDTRQSRTLFGAPERCPLGHILTYYDGSQPQYTHLRASALGFAHINLISILSRFTQDEADSVATDSIYIQRTALHKLEGVEAYVTHGSCCCGGDFCFACKFDVPLHPTVAPGQWRDKGEQIFMPKEHAAYFARPEYICSLAGPKALNSTAPRRATMTRCRGTA